MKMTTDHDVGVTGRNACTYMRSGMRPLSPSFSYREATEAMIEPISPKSANRRSLGLDENTYNFLIGKSFESTKQIGSCPYCRLGSSVEHECPALPARIDSREQLRDLSTQTQSETNERNLNAHGVITISPGESYCPNQIMVEGWLYKKGSGNDYMGSRGWKARWGRLCMAQRVGDGSNGNNQVPLLLLYWFPTSSTVSTAIMLDSTVVLGKDLEDKTKWNPYRFEVRHASTKENATLSSTRTFAAPKPARDAWVYAISQALLTHAKAKDRYQKQQQLATSNNFITRRNNLPKPHREAPPRLQQQKDHGSSGQSASVSQLEALPPALDVRFAMTKRFNDIHVSKSAATGR